MFSLLLLGRDAHAEPFDFGIPMIDLADAKHRQVVVDREAGQYLGHPTTVLLEDNKTITCLDLNDNPGLTPSFHKTIALLLVRNIDHLKRSRCQIKKQWVKKGTIYFKVPQQSKPSLAPSKAP